MGTGTYEDRERLLAEIEKLRQRITELEKSEAALKTSAERFWRLAENAPFMIYRMSLPDGIYEYVSPASTGLTGYTPEEWYRNPLLIRKIIHPDSSAYLANEWSRLMEGEALPYYEFKFIHKSGEGKWAFQTNVLIRDDAGHPVAIEGVVIDTTERKRAEETLDKAEKEYHSFLDNAIVGMFQSTPDGRFLFVNRALALIHGFDSPEEMRAAITNIGEQVYVLKEDRARFQELLNQGRLEKFEAEFYRKDGNKIWTSTTARAVRDETGKILFYEGTSEDITEHKRAEDELRQSEAKYRTLLESINDGVFIVNQERCFTFVNDFIVHRSGHPRESFIGKDFLEVIQPEYRELARKNFEADMRGETLPPYEVALNYPGSSRHGRWIEINRKPLWDGAKIVGVIGVSRDITARRQMEEELLRNRALESLGTLAGGIAHDFNNLLMAVTGYISIAKIALPPDSEEFGFLSEAERISLAGKELTQKLIAFSRGGASLKTVMVLNPLVEYVSRIALSGSNVECSFSLSDNLIPVEADETQIGQVIHNVVANAREAMPEGGSIHVTTSNVTVPGEENVSLPAGDYIKISIEDYGTGIKEEDLPKIFDPYFTTKGMGATKGMGLGLAIAYSTVKKHNGLIVVESMPGEGTIVDIYLPAHKAARAEAVREEPFRPLRKKVLFMDDDENVRNIGGKLISHLGYEVVLAKNGNEAVDLYTLAHTANEPFDAVILDLTVKGGMGGKEAFERLQSGDPHIRAIISSGYADDPIISNFAEFGFKGAMTKPYKIDELKELLGSVVGTDSE